jgi:lipoprotein-anchoring transpeptidase ErfK/SrfK
LDRVRRLAVAVILAAISAEAQTKSATAPKRQVVVSIPDRELALLEDGAVRKVYPVAVGASVSPSPTGQFTIISRIVKPTYYHKGVVVAPGPRNPLGTRWMGLSEKGYGIHGTNAPRSIGKAASHGCIRMAQGDLEELFELVSVGDEVEIVADANGRTAVIFGASIVAQAQTDVAPGGE